MARQCERGRGYAEETVSKSIAGKKGKGRSRGGRDVEEAHKPGQTAGGGEHDHRLREFLTDTWHLEAERVHAHARKKPRRSVLSMVIWQYLHRKRFKRSSMAVVVFYATRLYQNGPL